MRHEIALNHYKHKNFKEAKAIWESLEGESDQALTNLGLMYLKGEGVEKDFLKAKNYFEKAAKLDNISAEYNLGLMYLNSIGIEADSEKAKVLLKKAADKNHQNASFRLALAYLQNRADINNLKNGFNYMVKAAKLGNVMAKVQLSGLEEKTEITSKNETFHAKTKEQKVAFIEDLLNRFVRPMLIKDGGNIALIDVVEEKSLEIRLCYQGECAGCSLASTSTYAMIKDVLTKSIDYSIKVIIL